MPVRAPGFTSNRPPHIVVSMPCAGVIAARRSEPDVCAVPVSNSDGRTMRIGANAIALFTRDAGVARLRRRAQGFQVRYDVVALFRVVNLRLHVDARDEGRWTAQPAIQVG